MGENPKGNNILMELKTVSWLQFLPMTYEGRDSIFALYVKT